MNLTFRYLVAVVLLCTLCFSSLASGACTAPQKGVYYMGLETKKYMWGNALCKGGKKGTCAAKSASWCAKKCDEFPLCHYWSLDNGRLGGSCTLYATYSSQSSCPTCTSGKCM